MKITNKIRQDAPLICAVAASDPESSFYNEIAIQLGITSEDSIALAAAAWNVVASTNEDLEDCEQDALAEALLRTGWPGAQGVPS